MTARAADLPVGSVVANGVLVAIRVSWTPHLGTPWEMSNGGRYRDKHIDEMLADGAQVLRIGSTTEETK